MAKIIKLIYTEEVRGAGTNIDPHRRVPQLWSLDGKLILEVVVEDDAVFYKGNENHLKEAVDVFI